MPWVRCTFGNVNIFYILHNEYVLFVRVKNIQLVAHEINGVIHNFNFKFLWTCNTEANNFMFIFVEKAIKAQRVTLFLFQEIYHSDHNNVIFWRTGGHSKREVFSLSSLRSWGCFPFIFFCVISISTKYYSTHTLFHNIFTSRTPESTSSVSMGGQGWNAFFLWC